MKFTIGLQDTRGNNEDFAITPYLFIVWTRLEVVSIYGFGFCWGFYAIYFGLAFGKFPKDYPTFKILNQHNL